MNCYILILEEKVKAFSLVGHGQKCSVSLMLKGYPDPLDTLVEGDKVVGYVAGTVKTFCYLFDVGFDQGKQQLYLEKIFETKMGARLTAVSSELQELINAREQTESVINITGEQYRQIMSLMMNMVSSWGNETIETHEECEIDEGKRINRGANILLYGVPGSGKSWTIEHEYCHKDSVVERLVFHPDYTNADFIGQILPVVDADKQVTYEFTPGPFTTILSDAYRHPMREYILIIEELNRGNAPAIFGEVFQLLDRMVEPKTVEGITYPIGTSEYGITHKYMAEKIYGDPAHKVRIPSNLSFVGTMNTSDQNVFTLDTAFQRRWGMRLIENNFDHVRLSLANAQILDTEVTWQSFCEKINAIIVSNKVKMASAEDKRLGVYFIHESDVTFDHRAAPSEEYPSLLAEYNDLVRNEATGGMSEDKQQRLAIIREALIHNRVFPEKVIKYLWDDAFKFNPEALFDTDHMESLEQVIRTFVYSKGRERFKIFKPTVQASLYPDTRA
ncbi:AAA family ATPase [Agathobaculum sp.]|uniref:AAA family ATPase n=1 Tax=Agathobaculum sp. TaxID=2048138 RepID=UPI002A834B7F|nr:AAA family ATPase [Agathobaculum sp.]MDY3618386.1 AAA family ATPase [Agathobaculum sp.]